MDRAATRPATPPRRLIRLPNVMARTGLSKTTIWRLARAGIFPKSVNLTNGTVAWVEEEIADWIDAKIEARGVLNAPVLNPQAAASGKVRDPINPYDPTLYHHNRHAFRLKRPPTRRRT